MYGASHEHHLEEVVTACWAYWVPRGGGLADLRWNVDQGVNDYLDHRTSRQRREKPAA